MNHEIYNLHRYLTEEGIACHVRQPIPGSAVLVTDTYLIHHLDLRNTFTLKPLTGRARRIRQPKDILKLLKESNAT